VIQRAALIALRTLIGWHFLYEGLYKLSLPGWTRAGVPVTTWSAAGYLNASTGPLSQAFQSLAHSSLLPVVDMLVPIGLVLTGFSLMAGLFTQLGCVSAIAFLSIFYASAMPTGGGPQAGAEGVYLVVSKNLIELAAVVVVLAFRTGQIAGLDLLRPRSRAALTRERPAPTSV
jgi:thiosulfate dehydrogenase [quinone] large subunit